jgi:hypothetical protein
MFSSTQQLRKHQATKAHQLALGPGSAPPEPVVTSAAAEPQAPAAAAQQPQQASAGQQQQELAIEQQGEISPQQQHEGRGENPPLLYFGDASAEDFHFECPGQSIHSAKYPAFSSWNPRNQEKAFEEWLSGSTRHNSVAPAYYGVQRPESARAYTLHLKRVLEVRLDSLRPVLLAEGCGDATDQQLCLRNTTDALREHNTNTAAMPSRREFLFPDAVTLMHPLRFSLLVHCTDYFEPRTTLSSRCMALTKFVKFLHFLYAPPSGSPFDTQLTTASKILAAAKVRGGRFLKCRKLASEVVSAGRPPLINNLQVFAAALLANMSSALDTAVARSQELMEVRGPAFNTGRSKPSS